MYENGKNDFNCFNLIKSFTRMEGAQIRSENQITIMQGTNVHRGREIRAALDYVYQEWGEPCPLCVINIPGNKYSFMSLYEECYIEPDSKIDPNGITIPVIFQSNFYKERVKNDTAYKDRPLILINNEKLARTTPIFYTSVIVHELSHCRDYVQLLPKFQEKYNFNLLEARNNKWNDCIGGYFTNYSEMHAKYMQEKYLITHEYSDNHYDDLFFGQNNKRRAQKPRKTGLSENIFGIEDIENEKDYYYASFCSGQLRCWEELFADNPRAMEKVNKVKEHFLEKHRCCSIIQDMYKIFDWNSLIEKCDQLRQKQKKRRDAELSAKLIPMTAAAKFLVPLRRL